MSKDSSFSVLPIGVGFSCYSELQATTPFLSDFSYLVKNWISAALSSLPTLPPPEVDTSAGTRVG